jgi:hypothetical protein
MLYILVALTGAIPDGYTITRTQRGVATSYWAGDRFTSHKALCADGTPVTVERCHIAHRSWPLGSKVRVCSRKTGRCALSFVGDRGPFGACNHQGMNPRTFSCRGRWLVKIRRSDPGVWRGIADLSRCVWKKIGGPGMQRIRLDLLKKERKPLDTVARGHTNHPLQTDQSVSTMRPRQDATERRLWAGRSSRTFVARRRSTRQG